MSDEKGFERVLDSIPGYAIKTAATLKIADYIADGNRTTDQLANKTGTHLSSLERLMKYLCKLEVFSFQTDIGFCLTSFSYLLLDDHPSQLRKALDLDSYNGRFDQSIALLPYVVRTGMPSYPYLFGESFYSNSTYSSVEDSFAIVRAQQAKIISENILQKLNIPFRNHLVDVGGGIGTFLASIISIRSDLSGTIYDLDFYEKSALSVLEKMNASERLNFQGGDFFHFIPHGDLHILCNVIFNWDNKFAKKILRNCISASSTGRIVIIEQIVNEIDPTEESLALDLRNLVINGGKQRSLDEFKQLAADTGLEVCAVQPVEYRGLSIIEMSNINN